MKVGRICRKVRGRDAGRYCVVVEKIDKKFVLVDGKDIKRGRVNVLHLEPLPPVLGITKGASTKTVINELEKENLT